MSTFSDQIEATKAQFKSQFGEPITYNNGSVDIAIALATPRTIKADRTSLYDQEILAFARIWDIDPVDLVASGSQVEPAEGHTITDRHSQVWEVVADPVTKRYWEWPSVGKHKRKVFTLRKGV